MERSGDASRQTARYLMAQCMLIATDAPSPMAMVKGLWIIIMAVGLIQTLVPAMAMTDAALAAIPVILTVTSSGYSRSMV